MKFGKKKMKFQKGNKINQGKIIHDAIHKAEEYGFDFNKFHKEMSERVGKEGFILTYECLFVNRGFSKAFAEYIIQTGQAKKLGGVKDGFLVDVIEEIREKFFTVFLLIDEDEERFKFISKFL